VSYEFFEMGNSHTSICLREIDVVLGSVGEDASGIDSKQTASRFPLGSQSDRIDPTKVNVEFCPHYILMALNQMHDIRKSLLQT